MRDFRRSPSKPWPCWPKVTPDAIQAASQALRSGRWALTGDFRGAESCESRFARQFAAYLGAGHCVPTCNGSAALVIAYQALDIGAGDEVIVPGLTWVANATSVLRVNARPVLVDVEAHSLCISPGAIEEAITPRTRAITVVHLYSCMADMQRIRQIADRHALPIVEDAAQAHGARSIEGCAAGTLGDIGVFSFQEGKVLTAGEGGAAVTSDERLARRLFALRADGRSVRPGASNGHMELLDSGFVQGANYCLTEVAAALLSEGLMRLDPENSQRMHAAAWLDERLRALPGILPFEPSGTKRRTYYHYILRIDLIHLGIENVDAIVEELSDRLCLKVGNVYPPLNRSPLLSPHSLRRFGRDPDATPAFSSTALPVADAARRNCISFQHRVLLGTEDDLEDIVSAFESVWARQGWCA